MLGKEVELNNQGEENKKEWDVTEKQRCKEQRGKVSIYPFKNKKKIKKYTDKIEKNIKKKPISTSQLS